MTFAGQLRDHRARLKLRQPQMAALLGVSPRTYWAWESGEVIPETQITVEGALARLAAVPAAART